MFVVSSKRTQKNIEMFNAPTNQNTEGRFEGCPMKMKHWTQGFLYDSMLFALKFDKIWKAFRLFSSWHS